MLQMRAELSVSYHKRNFKHFFYLSVTDSITVLCIYAFREFIDYYKQRITTVLVTFLDASKSF